MWNVLSLSERSYTDQEWSGRFAKHTQQLSASRNIRETLPFFASRITIVTMLWPFLQYWIKIVMCWVSVTYSGVLLPSLIAPFTIKSFSNGCLLSPSVHCLISVGRIGTLSDRFSRGLPCERYKSDQNQIENEIIGTNSDCCRDYIKNDMFLIEFEFLDPTFDKF